MTESDVQRLEHALGLTLPLAYRSLLLHYPAALCAKSRVDFEDEDGNPVLYSVADCELHNTAEGLIVMNVGNPSQYEFSMKLENWPDAFVIIGRNDSGGVYAINASVPDSPVYFADQATSHCYDPRVDGIDGYFEKMAESIKDWVKRLIAAHGQQGAPSRLRRFVVIAWGSLPQRLETWTTKRRKRQTPRPPVRLPRWRLPRALTNGLRRTTIARQQGGTSGAPLASGFVA